MQGTNLKEKDCMSFEGFCKCIQMDVQKIIGSKYEVIVQEIIKNNDTKRKGLIILSDESNISPNIYLDFFYGQYEEGRRIDEIEQEIISIYEKNKSNVSMDVSFFTDWNQVKERIVFKLVNFQRNEELLKDVPHFKFLDLAMVFSYLMTSDEEGNATILIRNHHLEFWNATKDDLHRSALENTEKLLPYEINNMAQVLADMLPEEAEMLIKEDYSCPMYVLTNKYKLNGAACILYQNVLKDFSQKSGTDILILPSSTHEVLLIPEMEGMSYQEYSQMVKEVNETQVMQEEILSDHIYRYVRALDKVVM